MLSKREGARGILQQRPSSEQENKQDRFTQQNKLADIHAQLNSWRLIKVLLEAHS